MIEKVILANLQDNEEFVRKVAPFLKTEYFNEREYAIIFELEFEFFNQYNTIPSKEALLIDLSNKKELNEDTFKKCKSIINSLDRGDYEIDWLLNNTEEWCKSRAIYNALNECILITSGESELSEGAIPDIMRQALSVSFDSNVGHDFIDQSADRYNFYHAVEDKIPFDLHLFNKITGGGVSRKTLNVALAGCVHPETLVKVRYKKINI